MGRIAGSLSRCDLRRCFVLILVLCGTQKQDFSRMIREVEKLADDHQIIVQAGHTLYQSDQMEIFDFLASEKLKLLYEKATYIITHGGAGSLFQGIKSGKKTIVFPRLQKYGEHVDDHQLQLASKLEDLGYLLIFNDGDDIVDVFDRVNRMKPVAYHLKGEIPFLVDQQLAGILGDG